MEHERSSAKQMADSGVALTEEQQGSLLAESIAGTVGGVAGVYCGSPLDVVKTRMQSMAGSVAMVDMIRGILRQEGLGAFFKGSLAASLSQAPNNAIVFGAWGSGRRLASEIDVAGRIGVAGGEAREAVHVFVAGSYSGTLQSLALGPFEHVKIQQQVFGSMQHARVHLSLRDCCRAMLRNGGLPLLFRGTGATLLRDGPVFGVYFLSYEWLKSYFALASGADLHGDRAGGRILTNNAPDPPGTGAMLAAGAAAGVISWILALPVDVVKSRIQSAPMDAPHAATSIPRVARALYREGGLRMFFKGLLPCIVRAAPVNAVTFLGFEYTHDAIKSNWLR